MAALLRHAAARKLGGSMVQRAEAAVAEGRRRLGPRLVHTEKDIAEGKKSLKDLSDQVGPTPDGFDWRQVPFASYSKSVASLGNFVIKTGVFLAVASTCDVGWLFGKEKHPEVKEGA